MKILQKLKFIFVRHSPQAPTEVRPDDITSKTEHGMCAKGDACCQVKPEAGSCCENEGDCSCK